MSARTFLVPIVVAFVALSVSPSRARQFRQAQAEPKDTVTVHVTGTGVDLLNQALVHTQEPTPTGMIQQSTETVELVGDLNGRVLYHVTSVFDFVQGTLVNTGDQVYSGTVAGSAPVLLHDDQFRFEVNLITGEEHGQVYLIDHIAGPKVRCVLVVIGTGPDAVGNPTFSYTGDCEFRGGFGG